MPPTEVQAFHDGKGTIPIRAWLNDLKRSEPKAYRKCIARILELAEKGNAMRRPHADYLRDGIYELRASLSGVHYRVLYFFFGRNIVAVSHGLTKEKGIPPKDIEVAITRMNLVRESPAKYTANLNLKN
jgi:phage-related protein